MAGHEQLEEREKGRSRERKTSRRKEDDMMLSDGSKRRECCGANKQGKGFKSNVVKERRQ